MMRVGFALILLFITLVGCGGPSNTANTAVNNAANSASPAPVSGTTSQTVNITSPDGVILVGTFLEAAKPNSPALLLLHQWQSDRHSYDDFAKRIQAQGFNVLAIDGRGFGESVKTSDGKTVGPSRTDEAVKAMLGDVGAAFDFLAKQKNVDPNRIGIIGASYGSSLALIYAADNPKVASVALLSPGLNYFGNMQTEPAIKKYGDRPMLLIAASDDKESADAVEKLMGAGNNVRYGGKVFPVGGHGTALFKYKDTLNGPPVLADTLEGFFSDRFGVANNNQAGNSNVGSK
jgi:dienelactone hydrolase